MTVITLNAKVLTIAILAAMIASSICYIDIGNSNGESNEPFYITDSNGNVVEFEQTSEHVIILGYGYALSTIDLGCEENIVGVDYYTAKYLVEAGETQFEDLDIGNFYNSDGCVQIATAILQMSEDGTFDLETDWIIAPSYSYITKSGGLIDILNEYIGEGEYNLITLVGTATSYDDVMEVIDDLGQILGADSSSILEEMEYVQYTITKTVEDNDLSGAAAIQISSSGKVYNTSLMTSIITEILNGVNAGNNGGTVTSYSADYSAILQMASQYENTVIFVDSSYSGIADLKNYLSDYDVVVIEHQWDNICPEVTNCLWVMACALYPDYFTGDVPTVPAEEDNTLLYLGIGIAAAVIIAVVAVILIRKH